MMGIKMPCGKYIGTEIKDLPSYYLLWIAENWEEDTPEDKAICMAADREYQTREKYNCHFEE